MIHTDARTSDTAQPAGRGASGITWSDFFGWTARTFQLNCGGTHSSVRIYTKTHRLVLAVIEVEPVCFLLLVASCALLLQPTAHQFDVVQNATNRACYLVPRSE